MKTPRRVPDTKKSARPTPPVEHADGDTERPETPALEGRTPLPEEITGLSAGTDDDLVALFGNASAAHLADGFRGGSDDDPATTDETRPDLTPPADKTPE
jgi:hypothetical protein